MTRGCQFDMTDAHWQDSDELAAVMAEPLLVGNNVPRLCSLEWSGLPLNDEIAELGRVFRAWFNSQPL